MFCYFTKFFMVLLTLIIIFSLWNNFHVVPLTWHIRWKSPDSLQVSLPVCWIFCFCIALIYSVLISHGVLHIGCILQIMFKTLFLLLSYLLFWYGVGHFTVIVVISSGLGLAWDINVLDLQKAGFKAKKSEQKQFSIY